MKSLRSLSLLLLLAAGNGHGYEDGAPPGHTAGFGEPDCSACHSDSDKNPPDGALEISGLPDTYSPGQRYDLAVVLKYPALRSGGFQLSVRSAAGEPAGEVVSLSRRTRVVSADGQDYLQHSRDGREPATDGLIRWSFQWIAPCGAEHPIVHLHVAANAANDDISALGDRIFTLERELRAKEE